MSYCTLDFRMDCNTYIDTSNFLIFDQYIMLIPNILKISFMLFIIVKYFSRVAWVCYRYLPTSIVLSLSLCDNYLYQENEIVIVYSI